MGASRRYRRRLRPRAGRLFVMPEVQEAMPEELRDALAMRNAATVSGHCRCGAVVELASRPAPGTLTLAVMRHEHHCHASDDRVAALWAAWKAG